MLILVMLVSGVVASHIYPANDQIERFKEETSGPIGIMSTSAGAPIPYEQANITLNKKLIANEYFMDSITHLVRERIPERVVHAKGSGAFGYFEVTHNITNICKATLFNEVGKITPVAARFSTIFEHKGSGDAIRSARGFAVKFYTEEGNFDIVGLNTPVFAIADPVLFSSFVHSQKENPANNLFDHNTMWDFLTLHPESLHMFLNTFLDGGIPKGYQYMPGFGVHTFQVENEHGKVHFVRFHFTPDLGIQDLLPEEAKKLEAEDPYYNTRDLYRIIETGDYPSWTLGIQVLTMDEVNSAKLNPFDVTLVLPIADYPVENVGKLVLNRNAVNYFAQIEQLAFNPANLVPGILGGPDKVFEARRLAYRDAQYYRLGANFNKIRVNCPIKNLLTYNRDGQAPVMDNNNGNPNYYPNSFNGPVPYVEKNNVSLIDIVDQTSSNLQQITQLYINETTSDHKDRLVQNILDSLGPVAQFIKDRAIQIFKMIDPDLGDSIEKGLSSKVPDN